MRYLAITALLCAAALTPGCGGGERIGETSYSEGAETAAPDVAEPYAAEPEADETGADEPEEAAPE
jgi:hypothetical protein